MQLRIMEDQSFNKGRAVPFYTTSFMSKRSCCNFPNEMLAGKKAKKRKEKAILVLLSLAIKGSGIKGVKTWR